MKLSNTLESVSATVAPVRLATLTGCLLLLVLQHAGAGTMNDPDLVDPANDIQLLPAGLVANVASPEIDILALWVETTPTIIRTTVQIQDVSHRVQHDEAIFLSLHFENEEYASALIRAQHAFGQWQYFFSATYHNGTSFGERVTGSVDPTINRVQIDIPRDLVASTMHDAKAGGILVIPHPLGLGSTGGGPVWYRDWAPDTGPGATIPLD